MGAPHAMQNFAPSTSFSPQAGQKLGGRPSADFPGALSALMISTESIAPAGRSWMAGAVVKRRRASAGAGLSQTIASGQATRAAGRLIGRTSSDDADNRDKCIPGRVEED
jgi:hypothetical protein